jgi:hypothetical protein
MIGLADSMFLTQPPPTDAQAAIPELRSRLYGSTPRWTTCSTWPACRQAGFN